MRLTWSIHLYPPEHNCGSEWMAHNINRFLVSQGHEVRIILHQAEMHNVKVPYEFEGVSVNGPTHKIEQYQWADVILTHLEFTALTVPMARLVKRPVVHFVHNDTPYQSILNAKAVNIVYNSEWIANKLQYNWPSLTFTPFCDYDYINVNEGPINNEYITLINCNENKGGNILPEIAREMPDKKFLVVKGSYEHQFVHDLPNIKYVDNTKDIRQYYKQTRLLLMPSKYESWGMTATEAMCNGIPVISTMTPGLLENCGLAGTYIDERDNIEKWVHSIICMDDKMHYENKSNESRIRAKEICDKQRLNNLENFLYACKSNYRY